MKVFSKSDEDVLDYFLDLRRWMPEGDEISGVEVVYDQETTLEFNGFNHSENTIKVWFGGGDPGREYIIKVLATTDGGRVKEINFMLVVTER